MRKLVHGVGVNDTDYVVRPTVNGKQVMCPFYQTWLSMLRRCYSSKYQATYPAYIGCAVTAEWHSFMAFKSWMQTQDWQGKALDKDLLFVGNKIYSPDTCVFVDGATNNFTIDRAAGRGKWPLGVDLRQGRFRALCRNPFSKKRDYIGYFTCPNEAHQAWCKRKHQLALQLAGMQTDNRVADALRNRYAQ